MLAESAVVDDGQNHSVLGEAQLGSRLAEGDLKNSPFVPLSMKLLKTTPLNVVVKNPETVVG